ncbi:hypothetical protein Bacsa_0638 [Phocaeicola salanitronis DSM 18170]|uniref:Uncharacterized protein n=1 Tax=Phocaeicola salanitronis (strain DSM 18170 / JCM 13657 / CCUG 60908 / BL78) TaxID=667015 RepID=F0R0J8_PHOSB|nr:hypothetical protein Bacsa_0638 [Phocaeicola salanitronis DSM 18170]
MNPLNQWTCTPRQTCNPARLRLKFMYVTLLFMDVWVKIRVQR